MWEALILTESMYTLARLDLIRYPDISSIIDITSFVFYMVFYAVAILPH